MDNAWQVEDPSYERALVYGVTYVRECKDTQPDTFTLGPSRIAKLGYVPNVHLAWLLLSQPESMHARYTKSE